MKYIALFILMVFAWGAHAQERVIRLYQDADLTHHQESSKAIQWGIKTALDEVGNKLSGYEVELVFLNHRGNVVRSKSNYKVFLNDPNALAIYSGIHSPPLIKNRTFINEKAALTLVPWAAGGPITRYPSGDNWVFRLSVDDTRAGPVIIDSAMMDKQCKNPHLLLEDTPWGDSNLKSMSQALGNYGIATPKITRFGWNLKEQGARIMLRDILRKGADCLILVANATESITILQAVLDVQGKNKTKIISHWGVAAGNLHDYITAEKRQKIDLSFIQSCFAFTNNQQSDFARHVFDRLKKTSRGQVSTPEDLKSAVGFIHAYDLTKLLIAAVEQAGLSGDIKRDRKNVRLALENLQQPVQGLVKTYQKPFGVFDAKTNPNGHEALHAENFCMARFGAKNEILINGAR